MEPLPPTTPGNLSLWLNHGKQAIEMDWKKVKNQGVIIYEPLVEPLAKTPVRRSVVWRNQRLSFDQMLTSGRARGSPELIL